MFGFWAMGDGVVLHAVLLGLRNWTPQQLVFWQGSLSAVDGKVCIPTDSPRSFFLSFCRAENCFTPSKFGFLFSPAPRPLLPFPATQPPPINPPPSYPPACPLLLSPRLARSCCRGAMRPGQAQLRRAHPAPAWTTSKPSTATRRGRRRG